MANTKALSLAGIDEGTVVDGGVIAKSDDGSLSGLLLDNAVSLVNNAIPVPDDATKRQASRSLNPDASRSSHFGVERWDRIG